MKVDNDMDKFETNDGYKSEVINKGESVLFLPRPDGNVIESDGLTKTIKITLTLEEKDTNNVLAKTNLDIRYNNGNYKVEKNSED